MDNEYAWLIEEDPDMPENEEMGFKGTAVRRANVALNNAVKRYLSIEEQAILSLVPPMVKVLLAGKAPPRVMALLESLVSAARQEREGGLVREMGTDPLMNAKRAAAELINPALALMPFPKTAD